MAGQPRCLSEQEGGRSQELYREAAVEHQPIDVPEPRVAEVPLQDKMIAHVEAEDTGVQSHGESENDPELSAFCAPETREVIGEKKKTHHGERRADVDEQEHQDRLEVARLPVVRPGELEERGGVEQECTQENAGEEQGGEGLPANLEEVDADDKGEQQGGQPYY